MAGDIPPGFWALAVNQKENYTITPPDGLVLKISGAALPAEANDKARSSLVIKRTDEEHFFNVCTLSAAHPHAPLDLFFIPGVSVTFSAKGNSPVHVTGYLSIADEGHEGDSDEEDGIGAESDDEEQQRITSDNIKSIMDQLKAQGGLDMDDSEEEEEEQKQPAAKKGKAAGKQKQAAPKAKAEEKKSAAQQQKQQQQKGKKAAPAPAAAAAEEEDDEEDLSGSDGEAMAAAFGLSDDEEDSEAEGAASDFSPAPVKAQAKGKAQAKAKAKAKAKGKEKAAPAAAPATPKQKAGQKRKEPDSAASEGEATPAAKKAKAAATPKSAKPGTPGGSVKCSDGSCKKTFPSEAAMQQHAKAKHGATA